MEVTDMWHAITAGATGPLQTLVLVLLSRWVWKADKTIALLSERIDIATGHVRGSQRRNDHRSALALTE